MCQFKKNQKMDGLTICNRLMMDSTKMAQPIFTMEGRPKRLARPTHQVSLKFDFIGIQLATNFF